MAKRHGSRAKKAGRSTRKKVGKAGRASSVASAVEPLTDRAIEKRRRAVARAIDVERARREKEYDAAIADWSAGTSGEATAGTRTLSAVAAKPPLRILAEGDSWFDFPIGRDVIANLSRTMRYRILNLAVRGDEARSMMGVEQRQRLRGHLLDQRRDFNVLLFSGGGNDVVGHPFRLWLRNRNDVDGDPGRALNDAAFGSILNVVRTAYEDLLMLRDEIVALTPGRRIIVFLHQYDWAIPSGIPACYVYGPWLKPSLDDRGWTNATEARAIVKEAMLRFGDVLADVARGWPDVHVVQTQGALSASDWNDELHPNSKGFEEIAKRFRSKIESTLPIL